MARGGLLLFVVFCLFRSLRQKRYITLASTASLSFLSATSSPELLQMWNDLSITSWAEILPFPFPFPLSISPFPFPLSFRPSFTDCISDRVWTYWPGSIFLGGDLFVLGVVSVDLCPLTFGFAPSFRCVGWTFHRCYPQGKHPLAHHSPLLMMVLVTMWIQCLLLVLVCMVHPICVLWRCVRSIHDSKVRFFSSFFFLSFLPHRVLTSSSRARERTQPHE